MPPATTVVLGRDIRLMCGVKTLDGIEVSFLWSKYIVPLVSNRHIRIWRTDVSNKVSHTNEQKGYLKITGARYSDVGVYTCQAVGNNKVMATKRVFLTVQGIKTNYPCLVKNAYKCRLLILLK